jgi:TPP-dependent pyruvate/acetoin dehydrogenase alpha subunit
MSARRGQALKEPSKQPQIDYLGIHLNMLKLAKFEDGLLEFSKQGILRGSLHLAQGQEACPVGACLALRKTDNLTMTYRGHGYALAKGCDLGRMAAEILGRKDGLSGGKGGKMHLYDLENGLLGANGIVAGGIPTAAGAALSAKLLKEDRVALTVFGDGAVNQGVAQEIFNMAALFKLPLILFCENNLYSEMTPIARSTANIDLCQRMAAIGLTTIKIDGNDPLEVYETVSQARSRARNGEGATFIEALTYRTSGHYQLDPGLSYRSKEEVDDWRSNSPITRFEKWLLANKQATSSDIKKLEDKATEEVKEAFDFALASPAPNPEEANEGVFV